MASITFHGVDKQFEDGTVAVDHLDLEINDGEFMVLVGPSGCGKTTSLRMVAGLEDPTAGDILIGERVVNDIPSRSRDIAMVFQSYALYPHMTVLDNIAFGLRMQGIDKTERRRRAADVAAILEISDLVHRRPKQLSGGQRQRVAMGRAIVRNPQAFLMDEPLSNLDAKLRVQMRAEISRIQRRVQTTTLYVTHDQIEAMTMGDRVAVMRRGVLQQVDTPKALYDAPCNLFVAGFIGSPAMNLVEATVERQDDDVRVRFGSHSLTLGPFALAARPSVVAYDGRTVALGIRPENVEDASIDRDGTRRTATPGHRRPCRSPRLRRHGPRTARRQRPCSPMNCGRSPPTPKASARTRPCRQSRSASMVARCSARSTVAEGDTVELAVDTDRLQLFDLDTGSAIT